MFNVFYSSYRIVHRRVIWLVGSWVGVKLSASMRPATYDVILALLRDSQDLVVRMEAAYTLQIYILDYIHPTDLYP